MNKQTLSLYASLCAPSLAYCLALYLGSIGFAQTGYDGSAYHTALKAFSIFCLLALLCVMSVTSVFKAKNKIQLDESKISTAIFSACAMAALIACAFLMREASILVAGLVLMLIANYFWIKSLKS